MGFFQDGAPEGSPTIVSRLVEPSYSEVSFSSSYKYPWRDLIGAVTQHICSYYFPEAFGSPTAPQVSATNDAYDGWFVQADRLFFANGQRKCLASSHIARNISLSRHIHSLRPSGDPWRDATISADGTNFTSTASQPIAVGDGYHCSDLYALNAEDPTIASVQDQGLAAMHGWLEEWTPSSA